MEDDENLDQDCSKKRLHSQITIESELSPASNGNSAATSAPRSSQSLSVKKNLPLIPPCAVGEVFSYCGGQFRRLGERSVQCALTVCSATNGLILTNHGYGCTQLFQHASSCSLRNMKNVTPVHSAADTNTESWLNEKPASVHVTLSNGSEDEFLFSNVLFEGRRCQKCSVEGCSNNIIGVTGIFHAKQHVMRYHDRKISTAVQKRQQLSTLGTKGVDIMSNFFGRAKAKGIEDKLRSEAAKEADAAELQSPSASSSDSSSIQQQSQMEENQTSPSPSFAPVIVSATHMTRYDKMQELLDENAHLRRQLRQNDAGDVSTSLTPSPMIERQLVCRGRPLRVPEPFYENYPFDIGTVIELRWLPPDEFGAIRSLECTGWSNSSICDNCKSIDKIVDLQKLEARAADSSLFMTRMKDAFLTAAQHQQRRDYHRKIESSLRLSLSNLSSKLRHSLKVSSEFDRLMNALATGKIQRIHVIASRLLKQHAKPTTIANMLEKAVEGYMPSLSGTGHDEIEIEKAVALLILGGPRAVRITAIASGGASSDAARRSPLYNAPRFFGSSGHQSFESLNHNMHAFLATTIPPTEKSAWHMAFDNVNTEERLRYDTAGGEKMGGLKGVARESKCRESLIIKSYADVLRIQRAIDRGDILLTKETTMLVAIRNSVNPIVVPLFASGTAKVKGVSGFEDQRNAIMAAMKMWKELASKIHGDVISICSDHDSTNGRTMCSLKGDMAPGPRRDECQGMLLFDLCEGPDGVSVNYDDQHNGKNHRGKIIRKSGFEVHQVHFTREMVIDILHAMTGIPIAELKKYFPPPGVDDHQNVRLMVKGFLAISRLLGQGVDDAVFPFTDARKPQVSQFLLELQPLAEVASCWVFLFTKHDASLSDHVLNLSVLAGLLFFIRNHCKKFIPSQLYTAVITSVECVMNDIIACQHKKYKVYYIWIAATHLLELLFGVFRTMLGALRNFDALQLEERASHACILRSIYEKHPDWRKSPTRLTHSFDHWNTASWKGSVDVDLVNVRDIWNMGISAASEKLSRLPFYTKHELDVTAILSVNPKITLLNPTGSHGTSLMGQDEDDDDDACEEETNPQSPTSPVTSPQVSAQGCTTGQDSLATFFSETSSVIFSDEPDATSHVSAPEDTSSIVQKPLPQEEVQLTSVLSSDETSNELDEDASVGRDGIAIVNEASFEIKEYNEMSESVVELEEAFSNEMQAQAMDMPQSGNLLLPIPGSLPTFIRDHPDFLGEKVYIAALVSKMSKQFGENCKTTARVGPGGGRVANATAHGARIGAAEDVVPPQPSDNGGEEKMYSNDHACVIALIDGRPTAFVGELMRIRAPLGVDKSRSGITVSELLDPRSVVAVRPLKANSTPEGSLLFDGESSGLEIEIPGPFLQPIVLSISTVATGPGVLLKIGSDTMHEIAAATWLRIMEPPATLPALLKKAPPSIRHLDFNGNSLFQLGIAEEATTDRLVAHKCSIPNCGEVIIDSNTAIGHSAYHMMFTPTLVKNSEPCPLCLGPSDQCPAYLVKTGSSQLQPRIKCEIFSPGSNPDDSDTWVKFTASGMSKSTQNLPSTNVPIVCPGCNPMFADPKHMSNTTNTSEKVRAPVNRKAVMKYNMQAHWKRLHSSSQIPAGLLQALVLAPNERTLLGANRGFRVSSSQASRLNLI